MDIPFDEVRYPYLIDRVYDNILGHIRYPCWIDSLYEFTRIVRVTCIIFHEHLFMMFLVSIFGICKYDLIGFCRIDVDHI